MEQSLGHEVAALRCTHRACNVWAPRLQGLHQMHTLRAIWLLQASGAAFWPYGCCSSHGHAMTAIPRPCGGCTNSGPCG
eukprot:1159445-Pelagomonas_calceolata.AAC.12